MKLIDYPRHSIGARAGVFGVLTLLAAGALCAQGAEPAPAADPAAPAPAAPSASPTPTDFTSDEDRLDGDHLRLRVNVWGFKPLDGTDLDKVRCAPKGSKVIVTHQHDDELFVRIELADEVRLAQNDATKKVLLDKDRILGANETTSSAALEHCNSGNLVNDYTEYKISVKNLRQHDFRRTGVMFGALIVPFKFHIGGERKLSASSTVAPFVGFRAPGPLGLSFTPVVSAGLGIVPVNSADTNETETKSAFSCAIGVLLTHTKNDSFNAGVLFGKDFLSKHDRGTDDTVSKVWFSLYAGYKL